MPSRPATGHSPRVRLWLSSALQLVSRSFWVLPTTLTLTAIVTAPLMIQLDEQLEAADRSIEWLQWIYGGGLPGARRLLSAIAAAMMAISTVMFSSQTTALTFIGQEYGSRLLRNFLADSRNQLAFGIYVSTFVYALMVLRTIHKDPDGAPVPHVALSLAIILAMGSLVVLIYSMYHMSRFLQASTIIDYASRDLEATIRRLTSDPETSSVSTTDADEESCRSLFRDHDSTRLVCGVTSGYLQGVKESRLLALCRRRDCRIRIERRIGEFIVAGTPIATVSAANRTGSIAGEADRGCHGARK